MGGSRGGGGRQEPQVIYQQAPNNNDAMFMALLQQQSALAAASQQAAKEAAAKAAEEQKQAAIRTEDIFAAQRVAQGQAAASDALSRLNTQGKLADEAKKKELDDSYNAAGYAATGGGYDYNKAREEALSNLGQAYPYLSRTSSNRAASPMLVNPALTTAATSSSENDKINKSTFSLPKTTGLLFGGS
jgi:hypothetical protein